MKQYTDSYGTPQGSSYIANKIGVFDEYIFFRSGESEYSAIVGDISDDCSSGSGVLYVISRASSSYSTYQVSASTVENEEIEISNEYYVYSNVGLGQQLEIYQHQQIGTALNAIVGGMLLMVFFVSSILSIWRRKAHV